ncbi:hypothetical protein [Delftia sp. ZNC0008]|uniref:hypothetical protein n=1 Tax=Delftia sp. ZNC0008 TaxID=1339242 RepID=UPI00068A5B4F|nr:hypothetical protein [Delftia sp. ZNC0008]
MQIAEHHREQFELAYATAWAKDREGGETPEQLAAEIKSWRAGDTYEEEFIRLRFGWEGYQWARASQCLAQIEEPAQPVLYVSPGQLANHSNPEGPESAKAGRYLPARKTPAGKFIQPLYAGAAPAAVAGSDLNPAEADLPDVEDMAHSAVQEALSFGVNHDVFHRWMRAVMDKTVEAMTAAPALEAPAAPEPETVAWLNKPIQLVNGEKAGDLPATVDFKRHAVAHEWHQAEPLVRLSDALTYAKALAAAPQAPRLGEDALHLLRRLLSNQHTFTGPEFRAAPQAPAAPAVDVLSQAVRDVLAERRRQVEAEGYDTEHDDAHVMGEIGALAALYLMPDGARDWDATSTTYGATLGQSLLPKNWTMPTMGEDRRRDLVKGIACGLAELERWDRVSVQAGYLECTQFHVLNQSALDLDTVAAAQAKEGGEA